MFSRSIHHSFFCCSCAGLVCGDCIFIGIIGGCIFVDIIGFNLRRLVVTRRCLVGIAVVGIGWWTKICVGVVSVFRCQPISDQPLSQYLMFSSPFQLFLSLCLLENSVPPARVIVNPSPLVRNSYARRRRWCGVRSGFCFCPGPTGHGQVSVAVDVLHHAGGVCGGCSPGVQKRDWFQPGVAFRAHVGRAAAERV